MADSEELSTSLREEIEALEAIFAPEEEFAWKFTARDKKKVSVSIKLAPLTAEDLELQYVGLSLCIVLDQKSYPHDEGPCDIQVSKVRGLDEVAVDQLMKSLQDKAKESHPEPVLFDLIDEAKEFLTQHNFPSCPCSICLFHIVQHDAFVRTECYHYFHSVCFGRYLHNYDPLAEEEEEVPGMVEQPKIDKDAFPCPICRTVLQREKFDTKALAKMREPALQPKDLDKYVKTKELEELQKQFQTAFQRQKSKGGLVKSFRYITNANDIQSS